MEVFYQLTVFLANNDIKNHQYLFYDPCYGPLLMDLMDGVSNQMDPWVAPLIHDGSWQKKEFWQLLLKILDMEKYIKIQKQKIIIANGLSIILLGSIMIIHGLLFNYSMIFFLLAINGLAITAAMVYFKNTKQSYVDKIIQCFMVHRWIHHGSLDQFQNHPQYYPMLQLTLDNRWDGLLNWINIKGTPKTLDEMNFYLYGSIEHSYRQLSQWIEKTTQMFYQGSMALVMINGLILLVVLMVFGKNYWLLGQN
jgi:predicted PurR-regulated permease PerM